MRTEKAVIELLIRTASDDDRVLGAYLEGSRANRSAPKDIFQDYDVVYIVRETGSFQQDRRWIDRFGERLCMQYPEDGERYPNDRKNCYGWLMQFSDGVRLDLHVVTQSYANRTLKKGEPYRVLLDKCGCLPENDCTSDKAYWVKQPDEDAFLATCNEFWWCLNNVAKGLWRDEPPYAMDMLCGVVRPELIRLLGWRVGVETGFSVSVGKSGKYLEKYLPGKTWKRLLMTYPRAATDEIWQAVFVMCDLVDEAAEFLAERLGFRYDKTEAENSRRYCEHVMNLPKDAKGVY